MAYLGDTTTVALKQHIFTSPHGAGSCRGRDRLDEAASIQSQESWTTDALPEAVYLERDLIAHLCACCKYIARTSTVCVPGSSSSLPPVSLGQHEKFMGQAEKQGGDSRDFLILGDDSIFTRIVITTLTQAHGCSCYEARVKPNQSGVQSPSSARRHPSKKKI